MQRREGKGGGRLRGECYFRVRKHSFYSCFFFKCWMVESVRFNRFQTLETETELNRIFLWFFNRLIRFFFQFSFFGYFFSSFLNLSIFLLTPTSTKLPHILFFVNTMDVDDDGIVYYWWVFFFLLKL